ncbi:type II secretion system F family protein [Neoactinobaculum massilliense]|uniref:type II secretion system F family protein n=1 Tax=Neoactinobaculum massilliense TaxID=2364794 RepID=UPI000F51B05B|nr:hypothetical protein [Neoactinobaculum massilliense]
MGFLALAVAVVAFAYMPRRGVRRRSKRTELHVRRKLPWLVASSGQQRTRNLLAAAGKQGRRRRHNPDIGVLVAETATRLRSGSTLDHAWFSTISRSGLDGDGGAELDSVGVPRAIRRLWTRRGRKQAGLRLGVPAAVAVCRLTHHSGAPAAEILETCAAGITGAIDAAGERKIAFSGPKSTVQVLSLLPILGFALAGALGGNPLEFFAGSVLGAVCLIAGLGLEAVGVAWTRRTIRRAEKES